MLRLIHVFSYYKFTILALCTQLPGFKTRSRKINQGKYGAINFNNMIPVPRSALLLKNIDAEPDAQYKRLLQNQYSAIKADWDAIQRTAENLRNLVFTPDDKLGDYDKQVKARCCNLVLLESEYCNYGKNPSSQN